jgi:hypothetical protein
MFAEFHILEILAMDILKAVLYILKHWLMQYSKNIGNSKNN